MVRDNRFVQDATKANCNSMKTREALWTRAVRKDGEAKNGAEKNLLFPRARVEAVLTGAEMGWVLKCRCLLCKKNPLEPMSITSLPLHMMQDWNKRRAFAILIYMGASFAASLFFSMGLGSSGFNLAETLRTLMTQHLPINSNPVDYSASFTKIYEITRLLFEPPFFQRQNVWSQFTEDHNLPFLFDNPIKRGFPSAFGTLHSFWLHRDFCDGIPSIDIPVLPEGQTVDAENEFQDCKLARKELVGSEIAFKSEKSILEFIAKENHPHLIKLYFAYQRGYSFNLVFPYYPASLQHVLVEGWLPRRQPEIPERFKASKLRHWLWEQILNVIDGLERVHNPKNFQDRLPDIQGGLIGGHFDIKPANILIDDNGQLVLADFGQAQIKKMSRAGGTAFTGPGGTLAYQPPPLGLNHDTEARHHWHRSYDVWSMACVMLETVHFVLGGKGRVKEFVDKRETEEPPHSRSSAFWTQAPDGRPVLKKCVQASLTQLKSKNDRYLTMVAKLLQRMFTIDAKFRGTILECLEDLSKDNLTDQWPWKDEDEISVGGDHAVESLQKLNVNLDYKSTDENYNSIKCSLHYFRGISVEDGNKHKSIGQGGMASRGLLGDNIRVVLDFEQDEIRHMQSDHGVLSREVLKPLTYFPQTSSGRPQENRNHPMTDPSSRACAFQHLHRKLTLNFLKSKDFYRFQAAMTHQLVYEASPALISKCWVSYTKSLSKNSIKKYGSGRAEIWKELSDKDYHDCFITRRDRSHRASLGTEGSRTSSERHIMPISPTNLGRPMSQQAMAAHAPKTSPTPRRLVIYLESEKMFLTANLNTVIIVKDRCDHIDPQTNLCLSLIPHQGPSTKHKFFDVGVFEGGGSRHDRETSLGNAASSPHDTCPGIPLDPKVLSNTETTKVEWLEMEFANPQGKTNFVTFYNRIFKDKPIIIRGQGSGST